MCTHNIRIITTTTIKHHIVESSTFNQNTQNLLESYWNGESGRIQGWRAKSIFAPDNSAWNRAFTP